MNIRQLFKGLYKLCGCGCGTLIPIINKEGKFAHFKHHHHHSKFIKHHNTTRENNNNWKGGRKKSNGYYFLSIPNYYRSYMDGYVREHIYIYEQYHKCCILPWGEVHHIDFNKLNNDINNLEGMMKGKHRAIHNSTGRFRLGVHKNTNRICYSCKSNKTGISKPNGTAKTPYLKWNHLPNDKINWYCNKCTMKEYYRRNKKD